MNKDIIAVIIGLLFVCLALPLLLEIIGFIVDNFMLLLAFGVVAGVLSIMGAAALK